MKMREIAVETWVATRLQPWFFILNIHGASSL
jgi:hypothetical protein